MNTETYHLGSIHFVSFDGEGETVIDFEMRRNGDEVIVEYLDGSGDVFSGWFKTADKVLIEYLDGSVEICDVTEEERFQSANFADWVVEKDMLDIDSQVFLGWR